MKISLSVLILSGYFAASCGRDISNNAKAGADTSSIDAADSEYASSLGLNGEAGDKEVEKGKHLENHFSKLDTDKSGGISQEEFLNGPGRNCPSDAGKCAEMTKKHQERKIADFTANAGDDGQLSIDEFKTLVAQVRARHSERKEHGPGKRGPGGKGREEGRGPMMRQGS